MSPQLIVAIMFMVHAQLCLTLQFYGLYTARLLCPWDFPGKKTGVGCHFLLQGIFLTQESPGLQVDSLLTELRGKQVYNKYIELINYLFMEFALKWKPTPVFLPGESQRQGSLVGCHLWGRTESNTTEAI